MHERQALATPLVQKAELVLIEPKLVQDGRVNIAEMLRLLGRHEGVFKQQRVYQRVVALVMGELLALGRHTVTQLLLNLGLTDADWSAWYRLFSHQRFDEEKMAGVTMLMDWS